VSITKNGQYQSSPLDHPGTNPAFTIRRHLLQAKEDHNQLEQMKRVRRLNVNCYDTVRLTMKMKRLLLSMVTYVIDSIYRLKRTSRWL
jgi:hypothetical protein